MTTQNVELVHPFYLHVPMMVSFVAALHDGVAYEIGRKVAERRSDSKKLEGEGRVGLLPSITALLNFDLRGKLTAEGESGSDEERTMVLRHTEASLFIRLRAVLQEQGKVQLHDLSSLDMNDVNPGELVEIEGTFHRNPLDATIALLQKIMPWANLATHPAQVGQPSRKAGGNGPQRPQAKREVNAQLEMFKALTEELGKANVHDVLVEPSSRSGVRCILPLTDEHFVESSYEELFGGQFRVLGKVTGKVSAGQRINLLKRSVLGYFPQADDLFAQLESSSDIQDLQLGRSIVEGPALHLFPLAVFV